MSDSSIAPMLRIMSLRALAYCERLFYLEEVEEIRVADHRVYAGRTLHEAEIPDDGGELVRGDEHGGEESEDDESASHRSRP